MARDFIGVGAANVRLRCTMDIDISGTGQAALRVLKPDGNVETWNATNVSNATSGIFYYDTNTTNLNIAGVYVVNGVWDPNPGGIYYGAGTSFTVHPLGKVIPT
jgi:hypothetical protein